MKIKKTLYHVLALCTVLCLLGTAALATGEGTPPSGGAGGTPPDGGGGGGSSSSDETGGYTLTGAYTADGETVTYSGDSTITSDTAGENVVLAQNGAVLTMDGVTLNKTGDYTDGDGSDFYAVNAVVAAKSASTVYLSNAEITSQARGANNLFASGEGSTLYAYNVKIHSTSNSSRGIDATYGGTVVGYLLDIATEGEHCAAIATDRGSGYISVANSTLSTAGSGSPLLYSTGTIEVENVTGEATGAQIVGMEGLNTVRIKNCDLTGANAKASEPVYNGVIIYQSTSGDSSAGTAVFEATDSTLTSKITSGSMFYITNTTAEITLQNTVLNFDSDACYLLYAAGNDGSNGWGSAGSNGATVTFTGVNETLSGNILCDGTSTLNFYLKDSTWDGSVVNDTTYTGDGEGVSIYLGDGAVWNVTEACTVENLYVSSGATVNGLDNVTVTGTRQTDWDGSSITGTSDFTVDRTAFNTYFNVSDTKTETTTDTTAETTAAATTAETETEMETSQASETVQQGTSVWVYVVIAVAAIAVCGIVVGVRRKKGGKGKHSD